jgi:hypothetical protein
MNTYVVSAIEDSLERKIYVTAERMVVTESVLQFYTRSELIAAFPIYNYGAYKQL